VPSTFWALAIAGALQAPAAPPPSAPPPHAAAAQAWPDDRPITRVLPNLGRDLKAIPSIETAWIMGAGTGAALALHPYDDDLAAWAEESRSSASQFGRALGEAWMQLGLSAAAYGIGRFNKDEVLTHVGSDLIRAQILNGVFTVPTKYIVNRERPNGGDHSFPSGHASAMFTTAAVLQEHGGWKFGVPTYALATFVAWTRVRDRSHWLSDAFVGAAIGSMAGRTVVRGHKARQWTVTPVKTPGGAAIFLVKR